MTQQPLLAMQLVRIAEFTTEAEWRRPLDDWRPVAAAIPDDAEPVRPRTATQEVADRNGRGFGWETSSRGRFATPADFPLRDCGSYSHVHAAKVWDLSIVQRSIFCLPVPSDSQLLHQR